MRNRFLIFALGTAFATTGFVVFAQSPQAAPTTASGQTPASARPHVFNSGEPRAQEDPVVVAHGKALYGINCQVCHGPDLRGGDMGGPNLLRSQAALTDHHGENIIPIIQGARQAQGMPNIGLNNDDAGAVAAYVRSVIGTIGSQGKPPGEDKPLNIVVGDATRGQAYFAAHCAGCHSVTGDLKDIATRFPEPRVLQTRWVNGTQTSAASGPRSQTTVEVTPTPSSGAGPAVSGDLVHIDDFLVTVRLSDGTQRSFKRLGPTVPRIVVHDPLEKHREMLPAYTDENIHDVTAYLVTLK